MLSSEFDKSKEDSTSKVKEFMQSTWKGYARKQLKSMLEVVDTTYGVAKAKADCKSSIYGS